MLAIALRVNAAYTGNGGEQIGSMSWALLRAAGDLSNLGPLQSCTGTVLRYRDESKGLRNLNLKMPLDTLIGRLFRAGLTLTITSLAAIMTMLLAFHYHPTMPTRAQTESIASFLRSTFTVVIVLLRRP